MSDDLSRVTERVRQNRTQRQTDADAMRGQQATAATREPGTFVAGDRVFDSVSGLEGEVVRTVESGGVVSATVAVRLADGLSVMRRPFELVWRPRPPMVSG